MILMMMSSFSLLRVFLNSFRVDPRARPADARLFSLSLSLSLLSLCARQYDELRKAHVEKLKREIALQGPSSLDQHDGGVDAHHPLLQRPTIDERIGFIPPPSSQYRQQQ